MKIEFSIEQLQIVDKAIQNLPYYLAAPLINHINKELSINSDKKEAINNQLETAARD